jgi:hypothetical protein
MDRTGIYGDEPGYGGNQQGQLGGHENESGYTLSGNHDRMQEEEQQASQELASGKKQRERGSPVGVVNTDYSVLLTFWNLFFNRFL